jgi:coproporphyrinogen III oxidase-like Fe-S oxidoreductase
VRRWNVPAYSEWVSRLSAGEDPIAGRERLTDDNIEAETVYLGLRTVDGLLLREEERPLAEPWIGAGWATLTETGAAARSGDDRPILRLTALGWLRLDSIAAALTEVRSRSHI